MRIKCPNSDIYLDLPDGRADMKFNCPSCGQVHRVTITITTPGYAPARRAENGPKRYATGEFKPILDVPIDADFVLVEKSSDQTPDGSGGSGTAAYAAAEPPPSFASAAPPPPGAPAGAMPHPQGKPLKKSAAVLRVVLAIAAALLLAILAAAAWVWRDANAALADTRRQYEALRSAALAGSARAADLLGRAEQLREGYTRTGTLRNWVWEHVPYSMNRGHYAMIDRLLDLRVDLRLMNELDGLVSAHQGELRAAVAASPDDDALADMARRSVRFAGMTEAEALAASAAAGYEYHAAMDKALAEEAEATLLFLLDRLPEPEAPKLDAAGVFRADDWLAHATRLETFDAAARTAWEDWRELGERLRREGAKAMDAAAKPAEPAEPAAAPPDHDADFAARFPEYVRRTGILRGRITELLQSEVAALNDRVRDRLDNGRIDEALRLPRQLADAFARFPAAVAAPAEASLRRLLDAFADPGFDPALPAAAPEAAAEADKIAPDAPPAPGETISEAKGETVVNDPDADNAADNDDDAAADDDAADDGAAAPADEPGDESVDSFAPAKIWESLPEALRPAANADDLARFYRARALAEAARFAAGGGLPEMADPDPDARQAAEAAKRLAGRVAALLDEIAPAERFAWRGALDKSLNDAINRRVRQSGELRSKALARVRAGPGQSEDQRREYEAASIFFRLLRLAPAAGGFCLETTEGAGWNVPLPVVSTKKTETPQGAEAAGEAAKKGGDTPAAPPEESKPEQGLRLTLRRNGMNLEARIPPAEIGRRLRVIAGGYNFTLGGEAPSRAQLLWLADHAAAMRRAGVSAQRLPDWEIVEGPDSPLAVTHSLLPDAAGGGGEAPPAYVFDGSRLAPAARLPGDEREDRLKDFVVAASALRQGIAGDESIPAKVRQALDPVLNGTYGMLEERDYFSGDFCRRLVEGDYLETAVPELPATRRAELAAYRAALSHLQAGRPAFVYRDAAGRTITALRQLENDLKQLPEGHTDMENLPPPLWSWIRHDTEADATEFVAAFPDRLHLGWMLSETYPGRHQVRPRELPAGALVRHLDRGVLAAFPPAGLAPLLAAAAPEDGPDADAAIVPTGPGALRYPEGDAAPHAELRALRLLGPDGEPFTDGDAANWNAADAADRNPLLMDVYGPAGFGFPPHIPVRNHEGDILALALPGGWIENPDFSGIPAPEARLAAMDNWLDRAAARLDSPGRLSLLYRQFSRYTLDSPLPDQPLLLGSHNASGDDHQTVHQFLARKQMGRFIGDCDDLAEFFQELAERQGRLSFVMSLPGHAACGYAEKPAGDEAPWNFVILQTGPVMRFTAPTLEKAVEAAYTAFDQDGSRALNFSTAQVPILLRFAGEETRTPYVLAARIYGDRAYAEQMVRVQGLWHEWAFSTAIREMEKFIETDRDIGNLKELASLYERVGFFEESAKMRAEELDATTPGDPNVRLSTLLDLAQLHHQAKDREKALEYIGRMEATFQDFARANDGESYARSTGFRLQAAMILCALEEPGRAWRLLSIDLNQVRGAIRRGPRGDDPVVPLPMAQVLTSVYAALRDKEALDGSLGGADAVAGQNARQLLALLFSRGFFRPTDSYNDAIAKYSILSEFAVAAAGRAEGVKQLLADGPWPEKARPHDRRGARIDEDDWAWIRCMPPAYLRQAASRLNQEEKPRQFDPETARELLEATPRALEHGERFGSMMIAEDDVFTARIALAFLRNDPAAMREVLAEVRRVNFSRFYDRAAMAFGEFCGLAPLDDFGAFIDAFHEAVPGRQHYFKVVYVAIDRERFDHALAMAKATAGFFPDAELLAEEARHLETLVPELKRRVAKRQEALKAAEEAEKNAAPARTPTPTPPSSGAVQSPPWSAPAA